MTELDEQRRYRDAKLRDGAEMGWLLAVGVFVACVIAIAKVIFDWLRPMIW